MNKRERVENVVNHRPVDQLPIQFSYTKVMAEKLSSLFQVDVSKIGEVLGNHLLRVDISYDKKVDEDQGIEYDWWGAGFSSTEEGYFVKDAPLEDEDNYDGFKWPDPDQPGLFDQAKELIAANHDEKFVIPNQGFALFERAWSLRGFEDFLADMLAEPELCEELLDKITDIQCRIAEKFIELGVDGGYFGDDYGTQSSLLMSPDQWRQMIKPRLAKMFDVFKSKGKPVFMHSDGNLIPILPDLIEIGLDCLNPVQPEIYDYKELKKTFGDKLAFYGGISTQVALPHGDAEVVRKSVQHAFEELACDGTGLILGPSHRMMGDIPVESVAYMLESIRDFNSLKVV